MSRPIAEECGVFGLWLPGKEVLTTAVTGLIALQHRGQESAGLSWSRQGELADKRGMGLVEDVFRPFDCAGVEARGAIGHVRYAGEGQPAPVNIQPLTFTSRLGPMALAHNGRFVNGAEIQIGRAHV